MTPSRSAALPLQQRSCRAYKSGAAALSLDQAVSLHAKVPAWKLRPDADGISRLFSFDSYEAGLVFLNAVAALSIEQDHHPDLTLLYKMVRVSYTTHSVAGLSENDFICAAKIDAMHD